MAISPSLAHAIRIVLGAGLLSAFLVAGVFVGDARAQSAPATPKPSATATPNSAPRPTATPAPPPNPIKASDVLKSAQQYIGVPYVWGGFSATGFDCSGYVSKIWDISRRTTDSIGDMVKPIGRNDLLPGDALNKPTSGETGHIRLFDKWATADKALMWVYEGTEPHVMHRVVPYDPRYMPVRRINMVSDVPMPPPPPLPADWNKPIKAPATTAPAPSAAAPVVIPPAMMTGRVLDEKTGQPVAKARVFYWTAKEQYSVSSVVTDQNGNFTTPKFTAGTYELAVYANGYDVEFRGNLNLRGGGTARFDIKIDPSIGATAGMRLGSGPSVVAVTEDRPARDVSKIDDPPTALPADHDIPNGHFFTQTGSNDGISGYAVTNDDKARFWDEFQRLGGVQALGYPVSRRFQSKGFTVQVMQKGVLQWRPELGRAWLTNVFDEMNDAGMNEWLLSKKSTPKPLDPSFDGGKPWAEVLSGRMGLFSGIPAMNARFLKASDPLTFFGVPTSRLEDMGNHFAIRMQRAVIQLWKVDVPWAKAGETTVANGGDVAKEAGLFPAEAIAPQRSPLLN